MTFGDTAPDDEQLAVRAAGGDQPAYGLLMRRHKVPIYNILRRFTGDPDEANDLLQESFVAAWQSIGRYDPKRSFPAWLRQIAVNKGRDWRRRRTVRKLIAAVVPFARDATDFIVDPAPSPETAAAYRQILRRVDTAIATLPNSLKEPFVFTVFDGLSQREAAELLGISEKAVETRVARARQSLSSSIGREPDGR